MSPDNPQEPVVAVKPEPAPIGGTALHPDAYDAMDYLRENAAPVLIGVGLAVAIFLGYSIYTNYKKSAAERASTMLFSSRTPEQFQQIASQYASTPAAPLALLALASQHFDDGQYDLAQYVYNQFNQTYATHPMKPVADLGKVQCLEAAGQFEEAIQGYVAFTNAHADHFMAPMATFGQARCLEQLGRYEEARAVYEDFVAAHPESRWNSRATTALLYVTKEMRAQQLRSEAALKAASEPKAEPPPASEVKGDAGLLPQAAP